MVGENKTPKEINKCEVTDCYSSFYHLLPLLSLSVSLLIPLHHFNAVLMQLPLAICDQQVCAHTSCAHRLFVSFTL